MDSWFQYARATLASDSQLTILTSCWSGGMKYFFNRFFEDSDLNTALKSSADYLACVEK